MNLDCIVFPSPNPTYTHDNIERGELLYIPKSTTINSERTVDTVSHSSNINNNNSSSSNCSNSNDINNKIKYIPCLLVRANQSALSNQKYALFFHGNAEDINLSYEMLNHIRFTLNINVIAPEFPGYGIYHGYPKEEQLFQDSLSVYDYMTKQLGIPASNIIVFGRSIGTSIATYLASQRTATALVLISPPLSIRYVVRDMLGKFISYTVCDRFKNYKFIEDVQCPILIIHGQSDSLIKYYHATELYNRAKAPCELILPENMEHNEFDFYHEFSEPLLDFLSRNAIFANTEKCNLEFPLSLFEAPEEFKVQPKNWNCLTWFLQKLNFN